MAKKTQQKESVQHGGHSGATIPTEVRSQTQGSLPYDHDAVLNSSARSGLQSGKKKYAEREESGR